MVVFVVAFVVCAVTVLVLVVFVVVMVSAVIVLCVCFVAVVCPLWCAHVNVSLLISPVLWFFHPMTTFEVKTRTIFELFK